jgi:hypothetical protein
MTRTNRLLTALISATALMAVACQSGNGTTATSSTRVNAENKIEHPVTTIQWLDSAKNIGRITEGEKVEITFRFRNTGKNPLVVNSVVPSCGCTIAEKPEEPVAPGGEGLIKASFNSQGRTGTNHKTLNVYTNTPEATSLLTFEVEVAKAAQ